MAEAGRPVLVLVCGLPGAGKTRLGRQLERELPAIRLCPDEWLADLGVDLYDQVVRDRLEHRFRRLGWQLLRNGQSVILEFGFWSRAERDEMRTGARALGVDVQLCFLDADVEELWRRLRIRNRSGDHATAPITRADLEEWAALFEAPTADETALFDSPMRGRRWP